MASKKYSFLAGVFCLLASYSFAQNTTTTTGTGYDVMDSSVVPSRRMPQYTGFKQGLENYPAKPRNQWELGIKYGVLNISGDVPSKFTAPDFGIHIRKAFGYVFSMRLEYTYGMAKGLSWKPSANYTLDPAWTGNGYTPANTPYVFYNYQTRVQDLALEGVFALNTIRFFKSKTGVSFYALAGVGGTIYRTRINALNGSTRYNFSSIALSSINYKNRKSITDQLKNMLDDTYETVGEKYPDRPTLFGESFQPVGHVGLGVAFKLSNRMNLAIEDRFTFTNSDLLDGQRWAEQTPGNPVLTQNFDTYNFASVGLNFNLGSKAVEPLWWLNPLDYAYQEIRKPRYMILPKPVLPDSDGDGVTDQFDLEVTPAGCP